MKLNKKGDVIGLALEDLFGLLVIVLLVLVPLLGRINAIADESTFEANYIALDTALMINSLLGAPSNFVMDYPRDVSNFVYSFTKSKTEFYDPEEQEDGAAVKKGIGRVYQNKNLHFNELITEEKLFLSTITLLKQNNEFSINQYSNKRLYYFIPVNTSEDEKTIQITSIIQEEDFNNFVDSVKMTVQAYGFKDDSNAKIRIQFGKTFDEFILIYCSNIGSAEEDIKARKMSAILANNMIEELNADVVLLPRNSQASRILIPEEIVEEKGAKITSLVASSLLEYYEETG